MAQGSTEMSANSTLYRPERAILELGDAFYDPVEPAEFPMAVLRFRNDLAAKAVGLDSLDDGRWLRHFARFEPLPDGLPEPLALDAVYGESATSEPCRIALCGGI